MPSGSEIILIGLVNLFKSRTIFSLPFKTDDQFVALLAWT